MQHNSIQPTLQGEQHPTIPKSSMQQQSINKAQTSRFYLDVPSPLGTLRLESDGEALTALHFEDTKAVHTTTVAWHEAPQLPLFKEVQTWLSRYFGGQESPTPSASGHSLSASRLATIAGHTPRPNHYLRRFGRTPSQTKRLGAHVGSSCGASSGKQSHQHNHTLSSCNRRKWRANRLCGRTEKENVFAQCRAWQYFAT